MEPRSLNLFQNRRTAASLVLLSCLVVAFFAPVPPPNGFTETVPPPDQSDEVLAEQFKIVTTEIQNRVEHEHQLFWYQFLLLGAIFAVVIYRLQGTSGIMRSRSESENDSKKKKEIGEDPLIGLVQSDSFPVIAGLASAFLLTVNVHILFNSMIIRELGDWVRDVYERDREWGWEHYLGKYARYHPSSLFSTVVGFLHLPTVLTIFGYCILAPISSRDDDEQSKNEKLRPWLWVKTLVFMAVAFSLASFVFVRYLPTRDEQGISFAFWFCIAGCIASAVLSATGTVHQKGGRLGFSGIVTLLVVAASICFFPWLACSHFEKEIVPGGPDEMDIWYYRVPWGLASVFLLPAGLAAAFFSVMPIFSEPRTESSTKTPSHS